MLNRVELIGNLGADPEIRYTRHGMPVAHLSLATNETWTDREGTRQDRVLWHRVEVWGEMARTMEQHARKGQLLFVEGALRYNEWTDREGRTRVSASVSVAGSSARVRLLGRPATDKGVNGGDRGVPSTGGLPTDVAPRGLLERPTPPSAHDSRAVDESA